jgi:nucleoside-diphosphate-sugar epimerase
MANLIFGCGYLGERIGTLWREAGCDVRAVTRSAQRAQQLARRGIVPIVGDITADAQVTLPQRLRTVLFALGFDRRKAQSIHDVYVGGIRNAIRRLPEDVEKFIYISSTGVYGQFREQEVDEDSPCEPSREGGRACLEAENLVRQSKYSERAIILRLAGIYGPGRIPRAADLLAGRPIDAPARGWLNLIQVDDAARIVLLAEERAAAPRVYVVSDGQPVIRGEFYAELARLLGAPPPRFVDPPAGSPAAARAASDKRINPRRMFLELSPQLVYPSYRAGLAAIVRGAGVWPVT